MRLTVVGCSGSIPGADSSASCYLLESGGFRVVLDFGSGAIGPLQRHTRLDAIDAVVLSHLHADHCLDLCPYFVYRQYGAPNPPLPAIPVYGPAGAREHVAAAYGAADGTAIADVFDFRTFPAGPFQLGPFTVQAERVAHPVEAYGTRFTVGDTSVTYSGDTGPCGALESIAAETSLLLCEASCADGVENPKDLHLTGGEAGIAAAKANVGQLVLTHIPPWIDAEANLAAARAAYSGPAGLAKPGAVYEL